jgi:ABC-type polar amino acid transport system ATPase subunit
MLMSTAAWFISSLVGWSSRSGGSEIIVVLFCLEVLTGGSLVTDGRVTQDFQKEKMRSNNSNDGNYLLLWRFFRN